MVGSARASNAGPNIICCGPFFDPVNVFENSTNASISFTAGFAGYSPVTLKWGNHSAGYVFSQQVNYSSTTLKGDVQLDFLEPGTTYDFELLANGGGDCIHDFVEYYCYYVSTFTTGSNDPVTDFSGFVAGANGASPSVSDILVQASCVPPPPQGYTSSPTDAVTDSNGAYVFSELPHYLNPLGGAYACPISGGFALSVVNEPTSYTLPGLGGSGTSSQWSGYWNQTIVTFAPQVVDFALNPNHLSTIAVVEEAEFTHSSLATLSLCAQSGTTRSFSTSSTASGSLFGLSFSVTSETVDQSAVGSGNCVTDQGEPGWEVWGEVETSGMMVFNSMTNRTPWIAWGQFYGPLENNGNAGAGNATGAPLQDWMAEPTQSSQACVLGGVQWFQYPVPANTSTSSWFMWVAGSVSHTSSMTWGFTAGFTLDLGGTLSGGGSASYSSTYTLGSTTSDQFYVSFNPPDVPQAHDYTVACSGGTGTYQGSDTGMVIHIWQDS